METVEIPVPEQRRVVYVVSEDLAKVSSCLPSNKNRSWLVHSLVKSLDLLCVSAEQRSSVNRARILRPRPATDQELAAYHGREYLDFVLSLDNFTSDRQDIPARAREFGMEDDCPPFPALPSYVRLIGGASLAAANSLRDNDADIAICWDGGRHHTHKDHAAGFCYVADCVLSILALKKSRLDTLEHKPRVMYIDLDLHFADGVSEAFASRAASLQRTRSQVLTLSIHHHAPGFYPASPLSALPKSPQSQDQTSGFQDLYTLSVPLHAGCSDATLKRVWTSVVEPIQNAFFQRESNEPEMKHLDYVIVQCGVDGLAGDPCGIWGLSLEGIGWCVQRVVNGWRCKTLLLGGGGYHSANAARAWAYFTSIALGRPLALDLPIPDHNGFPFYAPSFVLDVNAGLMSDKNTKDYLDEVEGVFNDIAAELRQS